MVCHEHHSTPATSSAVKISAFIFCQGSCEEISCYSFRLQRAVVWKECGGTLFFFFILFGFVGVMAWRLQEMALPFWKNNGVATNLHKIAGEIE